MFYFFKARGEVSKKGVVLCMEKAGVALRDIRVLGRCCQIF